jgi:hypothetical protein
MDTPSLIQLSHSLWPPALYPKNPVNTVLSDLGPLVWPFKLTSLMHVALRASQGYSGEGNPWDQGDGERSGLPGGVITARAARSLNR